MNAAAESYRRGWAASQRTRTYDEEGANLRAGRNYPDHVAGAFSAGWLDYAAGAVYGWTLHTVDEDERGKLAPMVGRLAAWSVEQLSTIAGEGQGRSYDRSKVAARWELARREGDPDAVATFAPVAEESATEEPATGSPLTFRTHVVTVGRGAVVHGATGITGGAVPGAPESVATWCGQGANLRARTYEQPAGTAVTCRSCERSSQYAATLEELAETETAEEQPAEDLAVWATATGREALGAVWDALAEAPDEEPAAAYLYRVEVRYEHHGDGEWTTAVRHADEDERATVRRMTGQGPDTDEGRSLSAAMLAGALVHVVPARDGYLTCRVIRCVEGGTFCPLCLAYVPAGHTLALAESGDGEHETSSGPDEAPAEHPAGWVGSEQPAPESAGRYVVTDSESGEVLGAYGDPDAAAAAVAGCSGLTISDTEEDERTAGELLRTLVEPATAEDEQPAGPGEHGEERAGHTYNAATGCWQPTRLPTGYVYEVETDSYRDESWPTSGPDNYPDAAQRATGWTVERVAEARGWISDCDWPDLAPEDVPALTVAEVLGAVERHYEGGSAAFLAVCDAYEEEEPDEDEPATVWTYEGGACSDCVQLTANGETPPEMDEDETAGYLRTVEEHSGAVRWVVTCDGSEGHSEFSSAPCDVCGSALAGTRCSVVGETYEPAGTVPTGEEGRSTLGAALVALVLAVLAVVALAGCRPAVTYSEPVHRSECVRLVGTVDEEPDAPALAGADYVGGDPGRWVAEDGRGRVIGYAAEEDSEVWNRADCVTRYPDHVTADELARTAGPGRGWAGALVALVLAAALAVALRRRPADPDRWADECTCYERTCGECDGWPEPASVPAVVAVDVLRSLSWLGLVTAAAEVAGADAGRSAATWCEPSDTSAARELLRMDEDGDPAEEDSYPVADLSGQNADEPTGESVTAEALSEVAYLVESSHPDGRPFTVADVLAHLGAEEGAPVGDWLVSLSTTVADAWTESYESAARDHVLAAARELLYPSPERGARTSWHLSRLADVADPDAADRYGWPDEPDEQQRGDGSPGAAFLRRVERDYYEWREETDEPEDTDDRDGSRSDAFHERADGAVPIYNGERWATFADLAVWAEVESVDPSAGYLAEMDGLPLSGDMTEMAGQALYCVALRLLGALHEEDYGR